MRRFALSIAAACGLALLTACGSGGGYGFSSGGSSNGSIDSVVFTAGANGQASDFFAALTGAVKPLEVDAIGEKGSGPTVLVVPNSTFTWSARFVDPSTDSASLYTYQTGTAPSVPKFCGKPSITTVAIPIYQQNSASLATPFPGYAPLPATQAASTVFVGAVPGVDPGTTGNSTYCLLLVATHVGDGVVGTKVVVVSNNP